VPPPDRRPIRQLAREQGRTAEELITELQEAVARERASRPPPPQQRAKPFDGGAPP
jgi:hypothetical protein